MASPSSEEQHNRSSHHQSVRDCSQDQAHSILGTHRAYCHPERQWSLRSVLANFCLRNQRSSLCDSSDVERKRDCPFCILDRGIIRSLSLDLNLDSSSRIQSCVMIFAEQLRCVRQEDAHEFLRYVIAACHNTSSPEEAPAQHQQQRSRQRQESGQRDDPVVYGGDGDIRGSFAESGEVSILWHRIAEIMDISLDVLHSNSVKDALQRFFQ